MSLTQYRKLTPPQPGAVRWTSGFWANYFELSKNATIPSTWDAMQDPINSAVFSNLYVAAGLQEGEHLGVNWSDGDCYKWMEAQMHIYSVTQDPKILEILDELIGVIAQAQDPDGYICTQVQLNPAKARWSRRKHHELYNIGHLFTAASVHYNVTGQRNFLEVAIKLADYLYTVFGSKPPELAHFGWNPSQIMGLVDLYRITKEKHYLELAETFVDMRGTGSDPTLTVRQDHYFREDRGDQNQDRVPLREEMDAVGHAVTAEYLYCGAADVYAETGDSELFEAVERIWDDIVRHKMYITGGVGAYHWGASARRDLVHEAFGHPYELPNASAYNETCANIAHAMFSWRMLNITGEAKYADVMETVIYNSGLSPVSIDGKYFFYTNPLRYHGQGHEKQMHDASQRWHTFGCYCCPVQVARTTAWMNNWAYSFSDDGVWVNLYSGSIVEKTLEDGSALKLEMETEYPWEGQVLLNVIEAPASTFTIYLRIPEWANGTMVKINGTPYDGEVSPGNYLALTQVWSAGDQIQVAFPVEARLVQSHPMVSENRNQVAVALGPVVYCLESVDLPDGVQISEIYLPGEISGSKSVTSEVLGGATILEIDAQRVVDDGNEALYKPYTPPTTEDVPIKLIPYYAWANRGVTEMAVWLPLA
ncbi:glycoside hydrolase family 127 protein [Chloroflexota bacterium]